MAHYKNLPKERGPQQPDEFISGIDKVLRVVWPYRRPLLISLALVLIISAVYLLLSHRSETGSPELAAELHRIEKKVPADRGGDLKAFLSAHGGSPASFVANLWLARDELEAGRPEEAGKNLAEAGNKAPEYLKPVVVASQASLLWQAGKIEEALKLLDEVASDSVLGHYPLLMKAQLLEAQSRFGEAEKIYAQILAGAAEEPWVRGSAQARLAEMKASEAR